MIFNSLHFLAFFALVVPAYYLLPHKGQLALLFVASCYFYMAFVPAYIFILFFLIVADFFLAIRMEGAHGRNRARLLFVGVVANLSILFFFKYFNFAMENLQAMANIIRWNYTLPTLKILLPIGLSFHVFQSLSYVIEVYRGKYPAERNLGIYGLYVMFFPQLVAGPIERPGPMLPQFHQEHPFVPANVTRGLELMLFGFFKKLVIADNVALVVNHIYTNLENADGPMIITALLLFSLQLYADFSGYSDIARGSARVLGYHLSLNFNRPYSAQTITDFWRRWHISLSSWLRDYVYYPLVFTGKRTPFRLHYATFITFALIGLWHGASWTFLFLGIVHAVYIIFGTLTQKPRERARRWLGISDFPRFERTVRQATVFCLVSASWVFFRAPSFSDAQFIFSNLGTGLINIFNIDYLRFTLFTERTMSIDKQALAVILVSFAVMDHIERKQISLADFALLPERRRVVRWASYYALACAIVFLGYLGAPSFIYFQF